MSDTDRMYRLLKREGPRGVHTLDLRRQGYSGNPSQRKADIEKKYGVRIDAKRETKDGRNGSRYRLQGVGVSAGMGPTEGTRPCGGRSGFDSQRASVDPGSPEVATLPGFEATPTAYDPWQSAA